MTRDISAKRQVMVLDDEPQILSSIQDLLENDFKILAATDAVQALEILSREEVFVIISDQRMPGMSGDEFLRRAREITAATRILITAYADVKALAKAVNYGQIYAYMPKPWDPMELRITVLRAADHYALARELEHEKNLFHTLMEGSADRIHLKDAERRYQRINRAQARFLDLADPKEAIGKTDEDLPGTQWSASSAEDERFVLRSGAPLIDKVEPVTRADGHVFWFSSTVVPIMSGTSPASEQVGGVIGISRDITERKLAEDEKRELQEQLAHSSKMEAVGRLAGGIAHDFNNLLTVINGYSRLLLGKLNPEDPLRGDLEQIERAGERAAALTHQLLAFSRKQVLQPRVIDFNVVIRSMRPILARLMGEDVELCFGLHAGATTIYADIGQLEQVIMNLAVNSRDAMPQGGRLSIGTAIEEWDEREAQAHPGAHVGSYVMLTVSDTGIGMDEETQRRVFEPFFTTKEVGKGTGLGLSMIHGIVAQSGGSIEVSSEPGAGTTFMIYLPKVEDDQSLPARPATPSVIRGTENVLVVEDHLEVRQYAADVLESYGYHVIKAESAAEALLLYERQDSHIDLVLTDVVMPKMSGKDLVNQLRQHSPELKVLFMSGYTDDVVALHGVLEQGAEFLQKPFSPNQLAGKVRAVLGIRARRILVVDDEAPVRRFLRLTLEQGGYEVYEAADGNEALELATAQNVDLVITDLVMPEKEGLETIQGLRRAVPGVGIIAISGAFSGRFLVAARLLGADEVLGKPVSPEKLLDRVREVLAAKQ